MRVPYTYLTTEFHPGSRLSRDIMSDIAQELRQGHFTLGEKVKEFEAAFANACDARYAIGVGNGTDALFLIMKALDIDASHTVVVPPNTFVATVGAILAAGARPVFADIGDDFNINVEKLDPGKHFLIILVDWGGKVVEHPFSWIDVIYDSCQSIGAAHKSPSIARAYSLHPLKNVNVWGDGGVITTDNEEIIKDLLLLRNHGLSDRDTWVVPGYNSRLDTIQAIVGLHVLQDMDRVTERRRANAAQYDNGLASLEQVRIPPRTGEHVYHLYQVEVERRDDLLRFLQAHEIEAKVHYPTPLHLQPALKFMGHKPGDFPRAEAFARDHISLPIHQYLRKEQIDYVVESIHDFYKGG